MGKEYDCHNCIGPDHNPDCCFITNTTCQESDVVPECKECSSKKTKPPVDEDYPVLDVGSYIFHGISLPEEELCCDEENCYGSCCEDFSEEEFEKFCNKAMDCDDREIAVSETRSYLDQSVDRYKEIYAMAKRQNDIDLMFKCNFELTEIARVIEHV